MSNKYDCDQCGACCRKLIVEIDYIDIQREPRLREVTKPFRISPDECFLDDNDQPIENPDTYMAGAMLACANPCPMIGADNLCTIYPSRPNVCVAFAAGSEQCQDARERSGLPRLEPVNEPVTA